jgi:hypothetical protein
MRSRPILTLTLCAGLAGCGSFNANSLNPFTWWGGDDEAAFAVDAEGQFVDPRPLIGEVTQLVAERTPGGVIIRATGLPPSQGYWSATLIPANAELAPDANGVLAFDFRAFPPPVAPGAGTPRTREIVTGYFLSRQALAGIRTVEVRGERNTRSIRP